jgi:tetratricopeptide (TPR) repeat protein
VLSLAIVASASTQVSKQRLDAIWNAVDARVSSQVDTWFEDGDYPKVIHLLDFEARYAPADYEVVTNLGWMQENVEDYDSALSTYEAYRRNNPGDKDRALPEAEFLFRRKQYVTIPALLEPVIKLHPHPNNFRVLAHAYERLKKFQDAKRIWNEYIAMSPNDLTAKASLARLQKKIDAQKS